ncbi:sugar ABC transporter ATP-binding protein [Lachnospiraceae bacterium OM04-12BH]|nr:sugar ABC transporter ATP-binding protein [Lachnospiraceae bacterium OM04-12BH]
MKKEAILQVNGIYKSFGVVKALKDVSISFLPGEIHGLIGENGSGKSTLSSIISGIYSCNQGEMILDGKVYKPTSIMDGEKHGICMIVQEMGTIGGITVAANVFAGKEELFSRLGIVNRKAMNRAAQEALDKIGASYIKAENKIDEESFENRKIVEIARAMFNDVKVLIIDETTTALSQKGRELIYQIMDRLKDENKVVIFISHDLDELTEHCNTVTVLRDGVYIKTLHGEEIQPDVMRQLMIGREVQDNYYRDDYDDYRGGEDVITVENVCTEGGLKNVSFALKKGEILGIGGLTDSGMHDLGRTVFGLEKCEKGSVYLSSSSEKIQSPQKAIRHKIGYVSKNRDKESILNQSNIMDNICLPSYDKIKQGIYIAPKAEKNLAEQESNVLKIKMSSLKQLCGQLSGGNKQKVALAKWLGNDSDILILDCPTRGIDVGVKAAIYKLMDDYRKEGKSILMISEELPELIGMSDRILILKDGMISKEFDRSRDLTESEAIKYMI